MFDRSEALAPITATVVADLRAALVQGVRGGDDAGRIDLLRALEELKSAAAGLQMLVASELRASQEAEQASQGVPEQRRGRGIPSQVGLALRRSPGQARRFLSLGWVLQAELPATFGVLLAGLTTEFRALIVARESLFLSAEDRRRLDREIAGQLEGLGDRQVEAEARRIAYRLDPAGFVRRARKAAEDRHVSLRPAPDTMARFSALLPVGSGVAIYAELSRVADSARAAGDPRSRGQVMADTLVERVSGTPAGQAQAIVHLVMSDHSLVGPQGGAELTESAPGQHVSGAADVGFAARDGSVSRPDEEETSDGGVGTSRLPEWGRDQRAAGHLGRPGVPSRRDHVGGPGLTGQDRGEPELREQPQRSGPGHGSRPHAGVSGRGEAGETRLSDLRTRRAAQRLAGLVDAPAEVIGYGPVPAGVARDLVADAAEVWVKRLWLDPETGRVERFDVRARHFPQSVRDVVIVRDRFCRTPWCGAPIRHIDHPQPYAEGGETTLDHSQGLCEQCNYAKQAPGWRARPADDNDTILTTTPTGHTYSSVPPPLLQVDCCSPVERVILDLAG